MKASSKAVGRTLSERQSNGPARLLQPLWDFFDMTVEPVRPQQNANRISGKLNANGPGFRPCYKFISVTSRIVASIPNDASVVNLLLSAWFI
ncbi:hypothetical protein RI103_00380 [Paraburkholderia sp. FT54]|uniref:hypothetical protein n=1 Tax=Paraburkholderia sp. FT54 TaxID=3074437 RepID=UPI0028778949|nr:hypothetical protein [Paraburkholderia sp. FT54]WNC89852.1 hypothetical protein RI103_00380 [Paraburkholderia sp. FT54]